MKVDSGGRKKGIWEIEVPKPWEMAQGYKKQKSCSYFSLTCLLTYLLQTRSVLTSTVEETAQDWSRTPGQVIRTEVLTQHTKENEHSMEAGHAGSSQRPRKLGQGAKRKWLSFPLFLLLTFETTCFKAPCVVWSTWKYSYKTCPLAFTGLNLICIP